nr:MAG TPA: hypothetical protein [Caudoviricetes sp.]
MRQRLKVIICCNTDGYGFLFTLDLTFFLW